MKLHRVKVGSTTRQALPKQAQKRLRPLAIRKHYLPFGQPHFTEREIAAVAKILRSGWVGMGS